MKQNSVHLLGGVFACEEATVCSQWIIPATIKLRHNAAIENMSIWRFTHPKRDKPKLYKKYKVDDLKIGVEIQPGMDLKL